MKKGLWILIILLFYLSNNNTTEYFVFNDLDEINSFYIEVKNLNTNNLDCINNLNIQSLEIDINPVYKIDTVFFYKNTNIFINNVINRLKNKGYYSKANNYLIEPIYIKKVLVYNTKSKIINTLETCSIHYNIN